jgi:hypothetical protein
MPNLRPFRDYDEHDVINLFTLTDKNTSLSSDGSKVNKGTLVQINTTDNANGWMNTEEAIGSMGNAGTAIGGTVSLRYGVQAKVEPCQSGQNPVGITLYDMAERDENGEKLLYQPRKADEMQVVLSGQAMPVATKGIFLYSGQISAPDGGLSASVTAGLNIYQANSGNPGDLGLSSTGPGGTAPVKVGKTLGKVDAQNHVLIKLEL